MYRLEKQTEPNVAVDLDSTLESQNTLEFCLVRENSKYAGENEQSQNFSQQSALLLVLVFSCS